MQRHVSQDPTQEWLNNMPDDNSSTFYVGVTDNLWYEYLKQLRPDEVNFWKPGGGSFNILLPGAPYLFKLHRPYNHIAGGAFFVRYSRLPLSIAWEAFEQKNGANDFQSFREMVLQHRLTTELDPDIGCAILSSPFFFSQEDWIPAPAEWSSNIVVGKRFDFNEPAGKRLWAQVKERLEHIGLLVKPGSVQPEQVKEEGVRYGNPMLVRPRLGQGGFRVEVTEAYSRRCAITGERTLPVLHAAHIKPYSESGPHDTKNGLLLRSDLHTLFDKGYITLTEDLHVQVSPRIRREFHNGRDYYTLHDRPLLVLPSRPNDMPSPEFIEWHNQHIYRP
jgi:putative restriction endonuclease